MEKKLGRNDKCWCGSGKKYKNCHIDFDEKLEEYKNKGFKIPSHKMIKTDKDIEGIKESAKINIACLNEVGKQIKAGMSTQDIDDIVYKVTTDMGGIPAPLNYEGFPKSVCTSINDEVCHGIPDKDIILKDGDIINVDCSTIYKGYYSDSSRMFMIGNVSKEDQDLVRVTKESVEEGIKAVKPWTPLGNVGAAVHKYCKDHGYSVVREIGGHGCGIEVHEDPFVSFVSKPNTGVLMVPGMCFTIEPMVNIGKDKVYQDADNGWTIYTEDGEKSAQWEVQLVVTEDGCEILSY